MGLLSTTHGLIDIYKIEINILPIHVKKILFGFHFPYLIIVSYKENCIVSTESLLYTKVFTHRWTLQQAFLFSPFYFLSKVFLPFPLV